MLVAMDAPGELPVNAIRGGRCWTPYRLWVGAAAKHALRSAVIATVKVFVGVHADNVARNLRFAN